MSPQHFVDALRRWLFRIDQQNRLFASLDLPGVVLLVWLIVVIAVAMFLMHRTYLQEE